VHLGFGGERQRTMRGTIPYCECMSRENRKWRTVARPKSPPLLRVLAPVSVLALEVPQNWQNAAYGCSLRVPF